MANFIPYKIYILSVLDEFIKRYDIKDPFLDAGCGKGEVALHLAKKGWRGAAIDITPQAVKTTRQLLQPYYPVIISQGTIEDQQEKEYNLILLLDVIEHIENDRATFEAAAAIQSTGSHLMLTVPSNPDQEWRWDDELYGHLRRYKPWELKSLLDSCGYQVMEMWDISFPIFWFLRRAYALIKGRPQIEGNPLQRTQQSPFTDAWEMGWISDFLSKPLIWKPAFRLQMRFRNRITKGHELAILAQRN
jgi:SAM-dependent methyltransferase